MNAVAWLTSPPVQAVCDAQRAEAQEAKQILEELEARIAKVGGFCLEIGPRCDRLECYVVQEGGSFVVGVRNPKFDGFTESRHDTLTQALRSLFEEK